MNATPGTSALEPPPPVSAVRHGLRRLLGSRWLDWLVPWQAPLKSGGRKDQEKKDEQIKQVEQRLTNCNSATLKDSLCAVEKLIEAQDERRRGVETRLSTIVGLTSIAATLATGLLVAQAAGTFKLPAGWVRWGVVVLGLYLGKV